MKARDLWTGQCVGQGAFHGWVITVRTSPRWPYRLRGFTVSWSHGLVADSHGVIIPNVTQHQARDARGFRVISFRERCGWWDSRPPGA